MLKEAVKRPHFRDIFEGNRSALKNDDQVSRVKEYKERATKGGIFGDGRTRLFPTISEGVDAVKDYFNDVEIGFQGLDRMYGLRQHYGEKLDPIQNEASRLMWIYGIETGIFKDHQRGLLLLGAAATLVDLHGRNGTAFVQEKKRMHHVIRMLAQSDEGTFSTKVDKWVSEYANKAHSDMDDGKAVRGRKMRDKAWRELQYTVLPDSVEPPDKDFTNKFAQTDNEWREIALANIDPLTTILIGPRHPHIQEMRARLGISETKNPRWIATTFNSQEFSNLFDGAGAFHLDDIVVFSKDIDSETSLNYQQHEDLHTFFDSSSTTYLGRGLREAEVESNIDAPRVYEGLRLLRYYVDDVLNYRRRKKAGDTSIAQNRVQGYLQRGEGNLNSKEEVQWNKALIDGFGLEGYVAYYMIHEDASMSDDRVSKYLLDYRQGAYRLNSAAHRQNKLEDLDADFYSGSSSSVHLLTSIIDIWDTSGNLHIWDRLASSPRELAEDLSYEQLVELSRRFDAAVFAGGINLDRNPMVIRRLNNLRKCVWIKRGFPIVQDFCYDFAEDSLDYYIYREKLLQSSDRVFVFSERRLNDIPKNFPLLPGRPMEMGAILANTPESRFIKDGKELIDPLPLENQEAVYTSFIHTLSQAVAFDFKLTVDYVHFGQFLKKRLFLAHKGRITNQQRAYAQAVLFAHHRIFEEESGDLLRVMMRMQNEVLVQ